MGLRGCDHGLGGKDNVKSKQRRAKKAERIKAIALNALEAREGKKRGDVVFDETARVEYLTGFRKRKQERRTFGLAMQKIKEKKQHKDEVKEKRRMVKEASVVHEVDIPGLGGFSDDEDERFDDNGLSSNGMKNAEFVFQDDQTKDMFGDSVTVVVDTAGLATELESHLYPDEDNGSSATSTGQNHKQYQTDRNGAKSFNRGPGKPSFNKGGGNKPAFNKGGGNKPAFSKSTGGSSKGGRSGGGSGGGGGSKAHKRQVHTPVGGKFNAKALLDKAIYKKKSK